MNIETTTMSLQTAAEEMVSTILEDDYRFAYIVCNENDNTLHVYSKTEEQLVCFTSFYGYTVHNQKASNVIPSNGKKIITLARELEHATIEPQANCDSTEPLAANIEHIAAQPISRERLENVASALYDMLVSNARPRNSITAVGVDAQQIFVYHTPELDLTYIPKKWKGVEVIAKEAAIMPANVFIGEAADEDLTYNDDDDDYDDDDTDDADDYGW